MPFGEVGDVGDLGVNVSDRGLLICVVGVYSIGAFSWVCICSAILRSLFIWSSCSFCKFKFPECVGSSAWGLKGGCTSSDNISVFSSIVLYVWLDVSCSVDV